MFKKILPIALFFTFFSANTVQAAEIDKAKDAEYRKIYGDRYEINDIYWQDRAIEENEHLKKEIIEKIKKLINPEKQEEAIIAFQKSYEHLSDFYWLLWDQNIHTAGMGTLDKVMYLHNKQAVLKTILEDLNAQENF